MCTHDVQRERLVLGALSEGSFLTMDELVSRVPELSWSELFLIIDRLSRRQAIILKRRGFEYDVAHAPHAAAAVI